MAASFSFKLKLPPLAPIDRPHPRCDAVRGAISKSNGLWKFSRKVSSLMRSKFKIAKLSVKTNCVNETPQTRKSVNETPQTGTTIPKRRLKWSCDGDTSNQQDAVKETHQIKRRCEGKTHQTNNNC